MSRDFCDTGVMSVMTPGSDVGSSGSDVDYADITEILTCISQFIFQFSNAGQTPK